jgi:hypothetical protein
MALNAKRPWGTAFAASHRGGRFVSKEQDPLFALSHFACLGTVGALDIRLLLCHPSPTDFDVQAVSQVGYKR